MKKVLLLFLTLFVFVIVGLTSCESVPSPKVTKAEFPFEIVYRVGEKTVTVRDVFVCEFDGLGWNENAGRHRQWKGYVKSTGADRLVLLETDNSKVVCSLGSPAYYMSDPLGPTAKPTPAFSHTQTLPSGGVTSGALNAEALWERYGIVLVSWEFSDPIENTFE